MSREKIQKGNDTAHECGQVLDEILGNVASVNELVLEIANASSEQASGVDEVNIAMREIDTTTHENTANANETSLMAKKLREESTSLRIIVNELMEVINGSELTKGLNNESDKNTDSVHGKIIEISQKKKVS
jgi:methyl-accepting chemotaxis protein